ncbi:hypothetical protein KC318_g9386 [Hortaea werneckii]|nr:hypothetical protein KC334_g9597 [Hortaea werneckii]KAI7003991.1 hypothetical protein KC355_g8936 [Hortaea werneckii]KAI7174861.1 hypothetical protein KC324_g10188 [Hortaea werneckii]KAI7568063.1 hypothetical protein KC316_g12366 [Hortaea werneckii]KAI7661554.1 hypothetical protein KC318_g9386 [Hortaea werneckii]
MAYVFALNNGYTSREHGYQTYHLVPSEAPMPPRPVTPPPPPKWTAGTVLERSEEPPVRRSCTPEPVGGPQNGPIRQQACPETPEPDESLEGTVRERSPEPPAVRPGTPERLLNSHGWKTFTRRASQVTSLRFNPEHVAALLRCGQIDGIESAMRLITPRVQGYDNLSTSHGAQVGRLVKELRSAALHLCNNTSGNPDIVDRASQVLQDVQPLLRILSAPFAPDRFLDRHGQQIRNRIPTPAEVQIYINRYAVGEDAPDRGIHISQYIEDMCAVMDVVPTEHQVIIGHALARPRRLPFQMPSRIGQAALPSDDAYTGSVLPTLPGTTEYLVDKNGSRLSSREAVCRNGGSNTAQLMDARRRGSSTTWGRAELETEFEKLRNLYHFTASPHLILVADWYDQFLTSFDESSLWDIYPDDTPATSFP